MIKHVLWLALLWAALLPKAALGDGAASATNAAVILTMSGQVEVAPAGTSNWAAAKPQQALQLGDHLRTGQSSRASLRLSDLSVLRVYESTTMEIRPPAKPQAHEVIDVTAGKTYFFNRDKPQQYEFQTPSTSGAIRGTEFNLVVAEDGRTELTLLDGEVDLANEQGSVRLESGEQATVEPGRAPQKTAVINAVNIIQWALYYPAVVDADELEMPAELQTTLAPSLASYRSGDLLQALAKYPDGRAPASETERVYRAALLLSVGDVDQAQALVRDSLGETRPAALAAALQEMIATVKGEPFSRTTPRTLASEWLAGSYSAQAHGDLAQALVMARNAATKSPGFGFAHERVAELEFSFGRTEPALEELDKSLALSPRNAEALALQGFVLSAQNKMTAAIGCFDQAIAIDGGLGNAWLGRGLCQIHQGRPADGLADLLVAASLEPRRSLLRSYLGKAFADAGDDRHANKELELARALDANDPTVWLYAALLEQQENRVNEALGDLDASQQRNDNRSLFRSRLLLDQDRAVGSANLASLYRDLGMTEVSVPEAARSVTEDYANASAHLFLSDSYYNLLDPTQFNLRYDTAWANELLLANLLSPVGGGRLSQQVSQQDYSKLFTSDGLGVASSTDARTDGMLHQQASQYGTYGDTAYALDLDYHHNNGVRVNNTLDNINWDTTIKQQVTPKDTVMLLTQYEDYQSGDNFQYYYQTNARPHYKFDEQQQPVLVGAWRHEWSPGINTLFLAGRLVDDQQFSDQSAPLYRFQANPPPAAPIVNQVPLNVNYHEDFEIYSAELNQIFQSERVTLSAGTRYQSGYFQTQNQLSSPTGAPILFLPALPVNTTANSLFQRETAYSYLTIKPLENLWLTAGAAADHETYPNNFRQPPISAGEATRSQLGPKGALVWSPNSTVTVRGVYTRSLGGVSLDESYRLEPTQLAGFPQAFRSLISESVVGSQSAPTFETLGGALDLKLGSRTYAGIQVERLRSDVHQGIGGFLTPFGAFSSSVSSTEEDLRYTERTMALSLNQLLGDGFVIGAGYKLTQADLGYGFPGLPNLDATQKGILQEGDGYVLFNHPSGFFARAEAHWYGQSDEPLPGSSPEPRSSFFQENLFAGYRFAHRHAELQLGILNLLGGDYHLDPLTVYQELPRKRVFDARLNFIF